MRLFGKMIKMEIRSATILFQSRCKCTRSREQDILWKADLLDSTICNNFSSRDIDDMLQECENLKFEPKSIYEVKGKQAIFRAKCCWVENKAASKVLLQSRKTKLQ